jgi:lycopene cyclase domain-containing protein
MMGLYLGLLCVSLMGTVLLDYRNKLALFDDPRRTVLVIVVPVAFFVGWDMAGVANGVFFKGDSDLLIGWDIATEIPIEEVLFLTLLSHTALLAWRFLERRR